ncbi:MAG: hypothetical protein KJP11_09115, partial [Gammaproteobacteria bacterium]|nr:hypothetical protein [Gammaproteobacteria bacterium]
MLTDLQTWMAPYLEVFGDHPWLKAVTVVVVFLILAWIFDHVIITALKKLSARTRFRFYDQVINNLHKPIHISVILIGMALAVSLLALEAPFEAIIYSSLKTIAFIVWTVFLIRVVRSVLRAVAASEKRVSILHSQTLP